MCRRIRASTIRCPLPLPGLRKRRPRPAAQDDPGRSRRCNCASWLHSGAVLVYRQRTQPSNKGGDPLGCQLRNKSGEPAPEMAALAANDAKRHSRISKTPDRACSNPGVLRCGVFQERNWHQAHSISRRNQQTSPPDAASHPCFFAAFCRAPAAGRLRAGNPQIAARNPRFP